MPYLATFDRPEIVNTLELITTLARFVGPIDDVPTEELRARIARWIEEGGK